MTDVITRRCEVCGRMFAGNDSPRFCSDDCANASLENSIELEDIAYGKGW